MSKPSTCSTSTVSSSTTSATSIDSSKKSSSSRSYDTRSLDRRKLNKRHQLSSLVTINDNLDAMYCTLRRRQPSIGGISSNSPLADQAAGGGMPGQPTSTAAAAVASGGGGGISNNSEQVKITSRHFPSLDDPHRGRKVVKRTESDLEDTDNDCLEEEDVEEEQEVKSTKLPTKLDHNNPGKNHQTSTTSNANNNAKSNNNSSQVLEQDTTI